VDSLFFRNNDYSPNSITMTVWVSNVGESGSNPLDTAIARGLRVSVLQDTRFNIIGPASIPLVNPATGNSDLRYGESVAVVFALDIAAPRSMDGFDEIAAIVVSENAGHATCTKDLWVEHESFPVFAPLCDRGFLEILWDENIGDYVPNPFPIQITVRNVGDGASDSTIAMYIGTPQVSLFEGDQGIKFLGTIEPDGSASCEFYLRPVPRDTDTTISLCFLLRGKGGYGARYIIDTCCVEVFVPAAKRAAFSLNCDIDVEFVEFKDHRYTPDPFTMSVDVTNIGTAVAGNVLASILLPPGIRLAQGETAIKRIGDIPVQATVTVSWELSPSAVSAIDTFGLCVRVFDALNNQAECCDSVVVDSIRRPMLEVACVCPDTIYADQQQGVYVNSPFDVFFHVVNIGSDYADSVKATIIIQSPSLSLLQGYSPGEWKSPDTLSVNGGVTFSWGLQASPVAIGTKARIVFRVESTNGGTKECVCEVYIQGLTTPRLDTYCTIDPADSLLFDPQTGGYFPPVVIYRLCATNIGGGIARNVRAVLAVPPGMVLAAGENTVKYFNPTHLTSGDTACLQWVLIPLKRHTSGARVNIVSEVSAENVTERPLCSGSVYIPVVAKTAALSVSRDNVGYTDQIIRVPVFIDDPSEKDIQSLELELMYNYNDDRTRMATDVIEFIGIETEGSLTQTWDVLQQQRNAGNDRLNFTIRNSTPLAYPPGVGDEVPPLLWLKFRAVFGYRPDEMFWTSTPVLWPEAKELEKRIRINDGEILPRVTDGLVIVSGDCLRPLAASTNYAFSNRPNPFNPVTTITYTLPVDEHVDISIFDAFGRVIAVLVNEFVAAGTYAVVFDGASLPSGLYFCRMTTSGYTEARKMILTK
jgi:hypothetical protein